MRKPVGATVEDAAETGLATGELYIDLLAKPALSERWFGRSLNGDTEEFARFVSGAFALDVKVFAAVEVA